MTKKEELEEPTSTQQPQPDSPLSIVSMVLGVVSITGPGLVLGIPAIITASIALKRKQGGRSLSLIGLITGIVGTVFSLLFIAFLCILFAWSAAHPETIDPQTPEYRYPVRSEQIMNN